MATFTSKGWVSGSTVSAYAGNKTPDGGVPGGAAVEVEIADVRGDVDFLNLDPGPYVVTDGARAVGILVEQPSATGGGGGGGGGTPDDGSVGTSQLADGGVTTVKINTGAVTTAKIGDAQVTAAKVAADVATQAELDTVANTVAGTAITVVTVTSNHTFVNADVGKLFIVDTTGAVVFTIPTGLTWATGTMAFVYRFNTGAVSFVPGATGPDNPTITSYGSLRTIARQGDFVSVIRPAGASEAYGILGNVS